MFFELLSQSLRKEIKGKVYAMIAILLASGLVSALLFLTMDVGDQMAREVTSFGANIKILPKAKIERNEEKNAGRNVPKLQIYLEEKNVVNLKTIFWRNNIIAFAPFLEGSVEVAGQSNETLKVTMVGTYFDREVAIPGYESFRTGVKTVAPFWTVQGEWPLDGDVQGVLVGVNLARSMGWSPGSRIHIRSQANPSSLEEVTVKGLVDTGGPEKEQMIAPLALVQRLTGLEGKMTSVAVSALTIPENGLSKKASRDPESLSPEEYDRWYCTPYVTSIAYQLAGIEGAIPDGVARPIWTVAHRQGFIVNKIQWLMVVVALAVFLGSGLCVASMMRSIILERSGEIGLMKAIGASDGSVYFLFLTEALVLGLAGGVLGCVLGAILSEWIGLQIFGSFISIRPVAIPMTLLFSLGIAFAGSFFPARLILKLNPAEVFSGKR